MSSRRLSRERSWSAGEQAEFALDVDSSERARQVPEGARAKGIDFDVASAVASFHIAFGLPRLRCPDVEIGPELAGLRVALLREEVAEFAEATAAKNLVALADALADIVYVAYGSALSYGIDLDCVIAEVHRANMSKLDERGRPVKRADGKVLKSRRYRPPDVQQVLQLQLPLQF